MKTGVQFAEITSNVSTMLVEQLIAVEVIVGGLATHGHGSPRIPYLFIFNFKENAKGHNCSNCHWFSYSITNQITN